jgi:hypothetical protein
MLLLSALLALSTVAFTAPAVSADSGHPNIVIQSVINMEDIDLAGTYWKKASLSREMLKDVRHWVREHKAPYFVRATACVPEYRDWLIETRGVARVGFRYFRGKATNFKEYPTDERAQVRVTQMLIYDRIEGRQADAQKDLLNCVFDNMPLRLRLLLF